MNSSSQAIKQACQIIREDNGKPRWDAPSGIQIKEIRKRLGLTQLQFSEQFRVDLGTLRSWEQNINRPECFNALFLTMLDRDPVGVTSTVKLIQSDQEKELA